MTIGGILSILHRDELGRIKKHTDRPRKWHRDRFIPSASCVEKECAICSVKFYLPLSKAETWITCGNNCAKIYRLMLKEERRRACSNCGKIFYPRWTQINSGNGLYCSQKCHGKGVEGEKNIAWNGGKSKASRRSVTKRRDAMRNYKRIPKDVIEQIGKSQKWKCVVCHVSIKHGYHVDHIIPLAKNGPHEKYNIQLLCKYCNCKKKDKDPIEFMQSKGYLL